MNDLDDKLKRQSERLNVTYWLLNKMDATNCDKEEVYSLFLEAMAYIAVEKGLEVGKVKALFEEGLRLGLERSLDERVFESLGGKNA